MSYQWPISCTERAFACRLAPYKFPIQGRVVLLRAPLLPVLSPSAPAGAQTVPPPDAIPAARLKSHNATCMTFPPLTTVRTFPDQCLPELWIDPFCHYVFVPPKKANCLMLLLAPLTSCEKMPREFHIRLPYLGNNIPLPY